MSEMLPALREMIADFERIARYDHSISIPALGALFSKDDPGQVRQLQDRIAHIYDVPFSFISTNGTTPLNVLALSCCTYPGDHVLIQRDSHVSIFAPIISLDLRPTYITPTYDADLDLPLGITPDQILAAHDAQEFAAVFLTYPNYFGIATDIQALVSAARSAQCHPSVIVDSAHGAYLRFHPDLPTPAEDTGADIVLQSTHKTAGALSQGSVALFNNLALVDRWYECVNSLGLISTSFSYIILQSVALGISQLAMTGEAHLSSAIQAATWARNQINAMKKLHCFGAPNSFQPGFAQLDPLRVTVNVSALGLTGFEAESFLTDRFKIFPEMGTVENVLFLFKPFHSMSDAERLVAALQALSNEASAVSSVRPSLPLPPIPPSVLTPRQAFFARPATRRRVKVSEARDCVSAETIACYPPGSAVVVAGELLTAEIIDFLCEARAQGAVLKGASDGGDCWTSVTVIERSSHGS